MIQDLKAALWCHLYTPWRPCTTLCHWNRWMNSSTKCVKVGERHSPRLWKVGRCTCLQSWILCLEFLESEVILYISCYVAFKNFNHLTFHSKLLLLKVLTENKPKGPNQALCSFCFCTLQLWEQCLTLKFNLPQSLRVRSWLDLLFLFHYPNS